MSMHIHSHTTVFNHVKYGVRLCAVSSVRCALRGCPAFEFMQCAAVCSRTLGCVRQSSSVRDSVLGNVRLSGSARSSVWLSSGAAVCVESGSEHIFKSIQNISVYIRMIICAQQ
jgi:hypothetical protein